MTPRYGITAFFDILAGLAAIFVVLFACIVWHAGYDFRAVFALTGFFFWMAGLVRGASVNGRGIAKSLRVSAGGLLGIAAIVLNNGPHLIPLLLCLFLTGVAASAAGLWARACLRQRPSRSAWLAGGWLVLLALWSLAAVPRLTAWSAFERPSATTVNLKLTVDGQPLQPEQLRGRIVVLDFWATWCAQCVRELPSVAAVGREFRDDPRVAFYAVDVGWGDETAETGRAFLARRGIDLPMAFDSGETAKSLGIDAIPALVLLGKDGRVRLIHRGYDGSENVEAELAGHLRQLLNE